MRRAIVLGCSVLLAVGLGCGGSSSQPSGGGGKGGGGTVGGGSGGVTGGGGGGTTGTGGVGGVGGTGIAGTGAGGTSGGSAGIAGGGAGGVGGVGGSGIAGAGVGGVAGTGIAGAGVGGRGGAGGAVGDGGAGPGGGSGSGGTAGFMMRTVTLTSADPLAFAAGFPTTAGGWYAATAVDAAQKSYTIHDYFGYYGIAWGCANATGDSMTINALYATVAETTNVTVACGGLSTAPTATITGTIAGLSSTQSALVDIASRGMSVPAATPTYSLSVPTGTWDLFARRITASPVWDRMIRRNSVIVGASGATFDLDFATEGFAPDARTVTFQGATASETTGLLVILRNTLGGSPFGLGSFPSGNYLAVPAAQLRGGDYNSIVASANDAAAGIGRRVRRVYTAAMNFTAVMPPAIPAPTIVVGSATPYPRPSASIPRVVDADRYDISYTQSDASPARMRTWAVQVTRGFAASAGGGNNYPFPDLSAVPGFQSWWGLVPGTATWQELANWSNGGVADLVRNDQTVSELDGREYKITQRDGTVTF